jgi:hypothetical protein
MGIRREHVACREDMFGSLFRPRLKSPCGGTTLLPRHENSAPCSRDDACCDLQGHPAPSPEQATSSSISISASNCFLCQPYQVHAGIRSLGKALPRLRRVRKETDAKRHTRIGLKIRSGGCNDFTYDLGRCVGSSVLCAGEL